MTSELNFEALPFEYYGEVPHPISNANASENEEFEHGGQHHTGGQHHRHRHHHRHRRRHGAPHWPVSSFPTDDWPYDDGDDEDPQPSEAPAISRRKRRQNIATDVAARIGAASIMGEEGVIGGNRAFHLMACRLAPSIILNRPMQAASSLRARRVFGTTGTAVAYPPSRGRSGGPWRERIWRTGAAPQWRQRGYFGVPSYWATRHHRRWDGVGYPNLGPGWNVPHAVHWPHYARGGRWWPSAAPQEPYGGPTGPDIGAPDPYSIGAGAGPTEYVRWAQAALNDVLGLQLPTNGITDAATRSAIRSFQRQQGLPGDGVIGPDTETLWSRQDDRFALHRRHADCARYGRSASVWRAGRPASRT